MALSEFDSPEAWRRDLDARWPERAEVRVEMVRILKAHVRREDASLLELGAGDGELMAQVGSALPDARLVAVDREPSLLRHTVERIPRVQTTELDLNGAWVGLDPGFDAVYSLQTLHDLGGLAELRRVYARAVSLLAPGGLLLNADFSSPQAHDDPDNPRRFPAGVHAALMRELGLREVRSHGSHGLLMCVSGVA